MKLTLKLAALAGLMFSADAVSAEDLFHLLGDDSGNPCCTAAEGCCETGDCTDTGCCGCGLGSCLDGLFHPRDTRFDDFISPVTNPIYFQDPRIQSEARFIFLNNWFPNGLGGGKAQVYALQVRAALTENLSFIATKDGFTVSQSPLLDDGWADVAAGLQYNFYKNAETQTLLSTGMVFEIPAGSPQALQGNGDGEFHLFLTGGTKLGDYWHFLSGSGFVLPSNRSQQSQIWYWSNHLDYQVGDTGLYLLGEMNWFHWMSGSNAFPVSVEGLDYANLGSVGVGGNNILTAALGARFKPTPNQEIGAAFQIPLTNRRDIMDSRLTIDWIYRF